MMNNANWKKHGKSIFSAANEVYGVGHCFFFDTPDGQTRMSYHSMAPPTQTRTDAICTPSPSGLMRITCLCWASLCPGIP